MKTLAIVVLTAAAACAANLDLVKAAEKRDFAAVRTLAGQGADVNAASADGTTALHWAAHWNDLTAVQALLKAGTKPNVANRYGATPLSEAAALPTGAIAKALLEAGADPKTLTTADGETVLMTAARAGNTEAAKLLIERGADIDAIEKYKGQTALMWAAAEGHAEIVKLLLAAHANTKVQSFQHETKLPRLSAASSVTPMPRGGMTAMSFAARQGNLDTIKAMLDGGVDINSVDIDNGSPLIFALMNKHYTAAKYLLDRGADPNLADVKGRAALYAAIDIRNEDYSALPNRKTDDPMPSIEVARLLLDKGADLKAQTRDTNNAFLFAGGIGYRDKNTTGTVEGALETVKLFLERGADINQTNNKGETALHGAAGRGADALVKFLIEKGASVNARTRTNMTPLDWAMGKQVFGQLPVPHAATVDLIKGLKGVEGKDLPPDPNAPKPGAGPGGGPGGRGGPRPPQTPAQQ